MHKQCEVNTRKAADKMERPTYTLARSYVDGASLESKMEILPVASLKRINEVMTDQRLKVSKQVS